jgi:tryptophanyl-tRNA synthetase
MSLKGAQDKGVDAESVIYMDDDAAEVKKKITRAFCTPGEVAGNPVLDYVEKIILPLASQLEIKRAEQNGGDKYARSAATIDGCSSRSMF